MTENGVMVCRKSRSLYEMGGTMMLAALLDGYTVKIVCYCFAGELTTMDDLSALMTHPGSMISVQPVP